MCGVSTVAVVVAECTERGNCYYYLVEEVNVSSFAINM
jgi:hypothetical protein